MKLAEQMRERANASANLIIVEEVFADIIKSIEGRAKNGYFKITAKFWHFHGVSEKEKSLICERLEKAGFSARRLDQKTYEISW